MSAFISLPFIFSFRHSFCWSKNHNIVSCKWNGSHRRWTVRGLCHGYGFSKALKLLLNIPHHQGWQHSCHWSWASGSAGSPMVSGFSQLGQVNDSLGPMSCSGGVRWLSSFSVVFRVCCVQRKPLLGAFVNQSYPAYFYSYQFNWQVFFINVVPAFGFLTSTHSNEQCNDWVKQLHKFMSCRGFSASEAFQKLAVLKHRWLLAFLWLQLTESHSCHPLSKTYPWFQHSSSFVSCNCIFLSTRN